MTAAGGGGGAGGMAATEAEAEATGRKADAGKAPLDLLPPRAVEAVGQVLGFGAAKYGADNWRRVVGWRRRYLGAALRHIFSALRGERLDPESGRPHLAHAVASLLFVIELELEEE